MDSSTPVTLVDSSARPTTTLSKLPLPPTSEDWLIEDTFRHRSVHLFAGPSGAGKTTLLHQMIATWRAGGKWFGKQCFPREFVYASCDRSGRDVGHTLERIGVPADGMTILGSTELPTMGLTIDRIVEEGLRRNPRATVFFVEGLVRIIPGGKIGDAQAVSNWMVGVQKIAEKRGYTFIFVTWSPKAKEGDAYTNPRQRAMGSVAFAGCSDTIILIEPYKDSKNVRDIHILSHNTKDRHLYAQQRDGDGMLIECESPSAQVNSLENYLLAFSDNFRFDVNDITDAYPELSRAAVNRTLTKLLQEHAIHRIDRGKYRRTGSAEHSDTDVPPGAPNPLPDAE